MIVCDTCGGIPEIRVQSVNSTYGVQRSVHCRPCARRVQQHFPLTQFTFSPYTEAA